MRMKTQSEYYNIQGKMTVLPSQSVISSSVCVVSHSRHVGCECPAGFEGPHCEHPIKGVSVSAMVNGATSNKSVGSIIGTVAAVVFIVAAALFAKERYVDKPKRDAIRRAHMPIGFAQEMPSSSRKGRRNGTRDIV